jgi:homoserine dehydrogenase
MTPRGIGIIGYGNVGSAVARLLHERRPALEQAAQASYLLVGVAVKDLGRARPGLDTQLLASPEALAADPRVDVLVELAGGVEPAFQWVSTALRMGKQVVTANKAMLAERAVELAALLAESKGSLWCEAAVAGGIPIIQVLDRGLVANGILSLEGILNGTCNYLLTRMERDGLSYDAALALAQQKGFAEADPHLDVSGGDAAHKLAVLASLATGQPIRSSEVFTEGIEALTPFDLSWAEQNGYRIKMLGHARFGAEGLELRVHPTLVRRSRLISQVMEEFNAVSVEGDLTGTQLYQGRGAGALPTASAVLSDLVQALRGQPMLRARSSKAQLRRVPMGEVVSPHYIHLEVLDQPGVVARVATAFAHRGISIKSMYQPEVAPDARVPVVFTTHPTADALVSEALASLDGQPFLATRPVRIRMETNHA